MSSRVLSQPAEDSQARERRVNHELAKVARCVGEIGPRINQVAESSGQFKESVRYRYRKFFLDKGISVQASPDYSKLGFTRLVIFAKLSPELESRADDIFLRMSEYCYLHSFTRTILSKEYVLHVALPRKLKEDCVSLFRKLRGVGLFSELKILEFEEMRNPPMKAEFYDFNNEMWMFDWPEPGNLDPIPVSIRREEAEKYDRLDLLILKELEIDANRTIVQIAENVGANPRALQFHYLNHVKRRGLIRSYHLVWYGSRFDFRLGRPITERERYVEITILLEGGSNAETSELLTLLNRLPFLWSEAFGPNYWAELFIPPESYVRFLEYIRPFAERIGEKMKMFVMDQTRALRFTISYKLFDPMSKQWKLDCPQVINEFGDFLPRGTRRETITAS
jgi:DNA-binding Lrp family transcriptional regulator